MITQKHHELDVTEAEILGAMDIHSCSREEAVKLLIGDPTEEERKHFRVKFPRMEHSTPEKADRMIRTTRLALARCRGKVIQSNN